MLSPLLSVPRLLATVIRVSGRLGALGINSHIGTDRQTDRQTDRETDTHTHTQPCRGTQR